MKAMPVLQACPRCQLPVQQGEDLHGLAWHDCEFVLELASRDVIPEEPLPTSMDDAERELISAVMRKIREPGTTPRDVALLIDSLAGLKEAGRGKGGASGGSQGDQLNGWVNRS